jgi:hypothetical protein
MYNVTGVMYNVIGVTEFCFGAAGGIAVVTMSKSMDGGVRFGTAKVWCSVFVMTYLVLFFSYPFCPFLLF